MKTRAFANRVALIVGAGQGIGAACAKALANAGAQLCVAARTTEGITSVCNSVEHSGGEAMKIKADLAEEIEVREMVKRTLERFGRLDFVINFAASIGPLRTPLWQLASAHWQSVLAVNVTGPFNLVRAVIPVMLKLQRGRLIFASSPFGDQVVPGMGAYGCSRAGANHFVSQLAAELEGSGVVTCLVYPGVTNTPGLEKFRSGLRRPHGWMARRSLWWDYAEDPATMADLFVWLCLQPAADVNGLVFSWNDPKVRQAVYAFRGQS